MGNVRINVHVLNHVTKEFSVMFKNVKITVEETSNRKMNNAFEEQHPTLARKIPRWNEPYNGIGGIVTYSEYFYCEVVSETY